MAEQETGPLFDKESPLLIEWAFPVELLYFAFIPVILFAAALFAASEASLFSLSRTQLAELRQSRPGTHKAISSLLKKPEALLSTVIIGNECLNILLATFVATLLELYFSDWDPKVLVFLSVVICSILSLVCSEIIPKIVAFRIPVLVASVLVYPASWAHFILSPFRRIFMGISRLILRTLRVPLQEAQAITEKDFLTLVEVGAESGSLEREEKELIYNVFHFSDLPVSSIMTPWRNVFFIHDEMDLKSLLKRVREKTFSRIPVVSEKYGHVTGILYTKELLKLLLAPQAMRDEEALQRAIFPPYYVSSHKKISKLFREFKARKVHIALVVDEYGKHLGVITLEDVLNALFRTQKRAEGESRG